MAKHCGNCNSTDVQTMADSVQCLTCGAHTYSDGKVRPRYRKPA